ncbi:ferrochelatase [Bacillus sp. FJAT-27916]|uniref:ferrochelatase n=1 Tax=Bacillaceae TaxID=186817 RepID=UPI000670EF40|nr:ferrochelatase [Bacillus sp. FJAT-27916]KMY44896.1 ferrochelatase [Bacillus sp. FJAT-27916]
MDKKAVLLVNLGTPDKPVSSSIRPYLKQFLSDRRVIDLPRWKWMPILHGFILPSRSKRNESVYQQIWTDEGSPLLYYSMKQREALEEKILDKNTRISLAMNYGTPSISDELEKLHKWGVRKLIILPLFPQYSSTTTASVWDHVTKEISKWRDIPEVVFLRDFANHPLWIELLKKRIEDGAKAYGKPDVILLSYHGIPKRYTFGGDDYPYRCHTTAQALKDRMPGINFMISYQSKFGQEPWLEPSTSEILIDLARTDVKNVHVISPCFTADCLETLEELAHENKQLFLDNGGESYHYLSAANDDPLFIDCLADIIKGYLHPTA